jgi:translocation and assembly module TamA
MTTTRRAPIVVWVVLTALALAAPETGRGQDAGGETAPYVYDVTLTGVADSELAGLLRQTSALFALRNETLPGRVGLDRRIERDRERLATVLRSAGYYGAAFTITVDESTPPARVTIAVTLGRLYTYDSVTVHDPNGGPLPGAPYRAEDLGLAPGQPALSEPVMSAEARIVERLRSLGFAFAEIRDRKAVVTPDTARLRVDWMVDPGPLVHYAETRIEGLRDVAESLVRNRLPWGPGGVYGPTLMEHARRDLAALEVFDVTRVELDQQPGPGGTTPVIVTVTERPKRYVGFSIGFATTDGFTGNAYWGHRNLFGGGERLRVTVETARVGAGGSARLANTDVRFTTEARKPDVWAAKQDLVASIGALTENPPAYERTAVATTLGLERRIGEQWTMAAGVTLEHASITTAADKYRSSLFGAPVSLRYDAADDPIDPKRGWRAAAALTPWFSAGGDTARSFAVATGTLSAYVPAEIGRTVVFAGRLGLGSVIGAPLGDIPHDKRLYAGGGGSVRGYGFQRIGPRNREGDPSGGRSRIEVGLEARVAVTESIGIVPFIDAATVSETAVPTAGEGLRIGSGLGLRYNTGFGPLRADFAVPLQRVSGDRGWQFYLSFGQAF